MEAKRQQLKENQHKLLVYLANLYTDHDNAQHEAGSQPQTCVACHEIQELHDIIDDLTKQIKTLSPQQPKRRRRRTTKTTTIKPTMSWSQELTVYKMTTHDQQHYLVRAATLAEAIDLMTKRRLGVIAYATLAVPQYNKTYVMAAAGTQQTVATALQQAPAFIGVLGVIQTQQLVIA